MLMLDDNENTWNRLMTAPQLADFLSVSLATVRRMTRDEQVPVVRVRSGVRFDPVAVVRVLTDDYDPWDCNSARMGT